MLPLLFTVVGVPYLQPVGIQQIWLSLLVGVAEYDIGLGICGIHCVLQNFERMVLVKQFDDDYCLFKQNSGSELSKCTGVPLRGGFFFFLFSFLLFHFFPQERVRGAFWFLYYSHVAISINFLWIEPHGLHFFFYTLNLILSSLNTWIFPFFENVEKKKIANILD